MRETKQVAREDLAVEVLEEFTPEDRQRRLGEVYGLLVSLARQKRARQEPTGEPAQMPSISPVVTEG